jgi:hypothetical protein
MAISSISPGATAPPFTLQALGSNRMVSQVGDTPLLLVFHDQHTVDKVQGMQQIVRMQYSDARQLRIASVVNMKAVPVFLRSTAESVMKGSYNKAAAILLDWDGKVSQAYGAHKIAHRPRLVLLEAAGTVRGIHQGEEIEQEALSMIADLLGPPAAPQDPAPQD